MISMYTLTHLKKKIGRQEGQSMVEFALVIPIFILLVCAIIDFGWIGFQFIAFDYSARSATWVTRTLGKRVSASQFKEEMVENAAGINPDWLRVENFKVKDSSFDPRGIIKSDRYGRYEDDQGIHTIFEGDNSIQRQRQVQFEAGTKTWYMRVYDDPDDLSSTYTQNTLTEATMNTEDIAHQWQIKGKDLTKIKEESRKDPNAWFWIGWDSRNNEYIWVVNSSMAGEKVARFGTKVTDSKGNKYVLWKGDSTQNVRHVEATLTYTFPRLTPVNKILASLFGSGQSADTITIHKNINKDMVLGRHDEGKNYYRKVE